MLRRLVSKQDKSINWIINKGKGNIECRYVRRDDDLVSAYVSSHNGCKMACKMCHLTQLNQTMFSHSSIFEYIDQIDLILKHYDVNSEKFASRLNVNFMARGEPLANKNIIKNYKKLYEELDNKSQIRNLELKMNISTIMPYTIKDYNLYDILCGNTEIYYSLYSTNDSFKKNWIPNALPHAVALQKIKDYQTHTGLPITLHWTFIEGENDNIDDIQELRDVISKYKLRGKFNLVRYNPPPNLEHTNEPSIDKLEQYLELIKPALINSERSKIVSRVGEDIYASCGTFIPDR